MNRKSMKKKVEERFKQIQIDRQYEEKSLRFDERRDFINDARSEAVEALETKGNL